LLFFAKTIQIEEANVKNKLVRKSNALIEASYKLYASEKRVILFLASMIKPEDKDFKRYKLSIKEFAKISGLKHKGEYAQVREITKRLINRFLEIQTPNGILQTSWLSSAEYIEGSGEVILQFDSNLKPFLLQLRERFTRYNLGQAIRLKSIYSIRIYELLKQYEKIGERVMMVDDLRHKLGLEKGQYRNFNSFKVYVLSSAQSELAEKTDISFEFEEIKIGRRVGKIRFFIKSRQLMTRQLFFAEDLPVQNAPDELSKLLELLPEIYRKQQSIKKIMANFLEEHGFDYVARNIQYTNQNSNAARPGANLTKGSNYRNYLTKALKNDFGLAYQEDMEAAQQKESSQKEKQRKQAEQDRLEREKIERERDLANQAKEYMKNFSNQELQELETEAIQTLDPELKEKALKNRVAGNFTIKRAMEKIVIERFLVKENMN
jgi:plasmid replication initiation protein